MWSEFGGSKSFILLPEYTGRFRQPNVAVNVVQYLYLHIFICVSASPRNRIIIISPSMREGVRALYIERGWGMGGSIVVNN